MKILVTGASSYAGARIYYDLKGKYELVGTYFNNPLSKSFLQLNLTDKGAVQHLFDEVKPEIVVHVANYPSPRSAVDNEENFIALNEKTTGYVADAANRIGAKLVFISSQAANNPDNIYGQLKAKSEELMKSVNTGYLVLRPSLMVGFSPNTTNPRPFNRILACLDEREKTGEFDTSWKLQPSYVGHLSQVIDKTIQVDGWNKAVPVFIDEIVTQYQIAHDILKPFGVSVNKIDQHVSIPLSKDDLTYFNSLDLHPKTYTEMIQTIIGEIKNRKMFTIN